MGDYDLSGLSSTSFENLLQALALKLLGAGTVVFGDGPDGGREATFEGRMDYPSQADPWDGYCVVQAKFRQRPEGTGKDGEWALAQLGKELKDFADPKKRRRAPEYYIFATNVVLSPVRGKGAKDKVAKLFRKYQKKVPVRGWRVWDFDQIGAFLDDAADIRRAYGAWVTPGDVLAAMLEGRKPERPDFLEVMTGFLARDLLRDRYANLEQAGHGVEDKIPLARVFVDLPVTAERTAEPPKEGKTEVAELVATLVAAARDSLDPASTLHLDRDIRPGERWRDAIGQQLRQPGRYVLVGGPGQGKTTVGQFVCQLFRVALLKERPRHLLAPEVHDALIDVEGHCEPGGLELPRARRFPVRIVLSDLATALSKEPDISLLEYVATLIRKRTSRAVSTEDLRTWLGVYPWLLVLDGLDEVPASTNRDEVLRKVEELWIDAAQCRADLLVLATTRPQGYNDDFSPERYRHLWLAPLPVARALDYARRLVEMRYAGEEERQGKILGRLRQASRGDATARLMRSPLQVTILTTLVAHIGQPPQDRWQLFAEYYEVIYRRERERDIPAAAILQDHRPNIDAIHHQVGLLLQLEAERAGGTEAILSLERFEKIVAARLEAEEYQGQELDELRGEIIEAAAHRLVFLAGLEAGRVGFEIRSLQEFMAAQALMSGKDEDVLERLRRIAPVSSWRNVFLFAAGRCFSQPDKEHFRETIFTLCKVLNDEETGEVAQAVLAGSRLALELLEDGVARRQPKYARLLAECACDLLEQPPAEIHARLAELAGGATEKVLFGHLEQRLSRDVPASLGAWATLFPLVGRRLPRARQLADRYWPTAPAGQLRILQVPAAASAGEWLAEPLEEAVRDNHPRDVSRFVHIRPLARAKRVATSRRPFSWFMHRFDGYVQGSHLSIEDLGIGVNLVTLQHAKKVLASWKIGDPKFHPDWLPLIEGQRFVIKPSAKRLAEALKRIAASPASFPVWALYGTLPWVLEACLLVAETPADAAALADRAAAGEFGDVDIWRAAERRWKKHGASYDDLRHMRDHRWPFDRSIASRGVFCNVGLGGGSLPEVYMTSIDTLADATKLQKRMAWAVQRQLGRSPYAHPPDWLQPGAILRLSERGGSYLDLEMCAMVARWAQHDANWLAVLDSIGRSSARIISSFLAGDRPEFFANLFHDHPDKPGLLPMFAAAVLNNPDPEAAALTPVLFEDFAEPPVRRAALLLELARGGLSAARAAELAAATLEMAESEELLVRYASQILEDFERFDQASQRYLLELRGRVQGDDWKETRAVLDMLENSFLRRTSGLADRNVWHSLALPEGLSTVSG